MFKRSVVPFHTLVVIFSLFALLLSGCVVKSGPKEFTGPAQIESKSAPDSGDRLAKAFTTTANGAKKFMFSGWSVTKIQKRNSGFYFTGGYDKEKGYNMDARIFGQPFRYYRWGQDVYVSEEENWRKINPAESPMEPFADFGNLAFLADSATQLPDGEVLGNKCYVYRIDLNNMEAMKAAMFSGAVTPENYLQSAGDQFFNRLTMRLTFWVGEKDNFIYQYKTETTMPVPDAGSLYQEVYCKFWDFNSNTVNIQGPERIEKYLVKD